MKVITATLALLTDDLQPFQAEARPSGLPSGYPPDAVAQEDDLRGDTAHAGTCQTDGTRRGGREVEHPAEDEGAAVVDRDDHAATAIRHAKLGAERQRAVGA